ncbi:MAG TPA: YetF domain-containing protein [Chryseosolibacter sp.]
MKKEEIEPWDFQRILFGQAPESFMLEVLVRTLIMYLILIIVFKILGKRLDGQLTLTELAVMVTLGAIIAVPMQIPDRGILLGVVALLCVVAFQRGLNWLGVRNTRIENATQGVMSTIIKNGKLQLGEMDNSGLSRQNVFAMLRAKGIFNLSKVKRLYFEACGEVSIYPEEKAKPGLSLLPPGEHHVLISQGKVNRDCLACSNCGSVIDKANENRACPTCGERRWVEAIVD